LSVSLREFYAPHYTVTDPAEGERLGRWRALGAANKAAHVAALHPSAGAVVEIGCGDGALLAALRGFAPVFDGFELSAPAASLARKTLPDARRIEPFDGAEVPAEDGAYDLAILSHVLEHVPVPRPLLAEAARVARAVLIEVPLEDNRSAARPGKRAEAASIGHLHFFSRAAVRELVDGAGLVREAELTDPLPRAHHAFFASTLGARAAATAKWGLRAAAHRVAPQSCEAWFTVHYAVLARRP